MLVVVAVIGILASILFPVFARVRSDARRTSCASNLKQIGMAVFQYTQDYDEKLPPQQTKVADMGGPNSLPGVTSWDGTWFYWQQFLLPYTKNSDIFFCPESTYRTNAGLFNYGANAHVIRSFNATVTTTLALSEIILSANTYMVMDYSNANAFYQYSTATQLPPPTGPAYYIPGSGAVSTSTNNACKALFAGTQASVTSDCNQGRHFGGVNMAFTDGHVKWLNSALVHKEAMKPAFPTTCTANCPVYAGGAWDPRNEQ
jgi:prepilin-type processing-associated H-X9-DG protein